MTGPTRIPVRTIPAIDLSWRSPEHDEGFSAASGGYTADVYPSEATGRWFWRVDAASAISESLEIFDCGFQDNANDAKGAAHEALELALAPPA